MLSAIQERKLFESLVFLSSEDDYLKSFYASQLGRVSVALLFLSGKL